MLGKIFSKVITSKSVARLVYSIGFKLVIQLSMFDLINVLMVSISFLCGLRTRARLVGKCQDVVMAGFYFVDVVYGIGRLSRSVFLC